MNKIYKLVWNNVRGCYVVASEFAKAHGKSARRAVVGAFVAAAMVGSMGVANAGSITRNNDNMLMDGETSLGVTVNDGAITVSSINGAIIRGISVEVDGLYSTAMGYYTHATDECATAMGNQTWAQGKHSTAMGNQTWAQGDYSTAMGTHTWAQGEFSTAMGDETIASGEASTAMGCNTTASGAWSTAMGLDSVANGDNSLAALGGTTGAVGEDGKPVSDKGKGAMAIGDGALALEKNTFAIGAGAKTTAENTLAFGNDAQATAAGAVAIGQGSIADVANTVSVGAEGAERKIVNVAAGDITSANSTEAVTGGQLYETNTKIGTWSAGNTIVAYDATTAATTSLGANLANLDTAIGDLAANKGQGNVIADEATAAAQIKALDTKLGSATGGNYIQAANTVAQNLSALDTQAKANADAIEDNTSEIIKNRADIATEKNERINADNELRNEIQGVNSNLNNKINQTNDRVDRVGATAAALAAINYQPMAKGQSQVAVGMGGYKGKKATALGLAYQISDRVSGSVAGSANGSERMFNVGFNYVFGQHSDKDITQCAAVPGSMSLKEAEMQAKIDSQDAKINTLEADNAAMKADNQAMKAEIAELKAMMKALIAK